MPGAAVPYERTLLNIVGSGIELGDVLPDLQPLTPGLPIVRVNGAELDTTHVDDFGRRLMLAFEFIDLPDILEAMANGNSAPWTLYDEPGKRPLLDRWVDAQAHLPAKLAADDFITLNRILADDPSMNFRTSRVIAGGDIYLPTPGALGNGYYPLKPSELAALQANPFLVLDIQPGPPAADGSPTYYGRHEYPSAATWRKVQSYLSPSLQADLLAAETAAKLADDSSVEFKTLNPRIIRELLTWLLAQNFEPAKRYQYSISIHPFTDYNGRTTRMVYQDNNYDSHRLFIRDFDWDLFLPYEKFAAESANGAIQLREISQAIAREYANNPGFPHYYDLPEPWMVMVGTRGITGDVGTFVGRVKMWFQSFSDDEIVRHKMYDLVIQQVDSACEGFLVGSRMPTRKALK